MPVHHIPLTATYVPPTDEDAAIVHNLSHVPFMAWLVECRDSTDYRTMLTLAKQRHNGPLKDVYPEWRDFAMLTFAQGGLP